MKTIDNLLQIKLLPSMAIIFPIHIKVQHTDDTISIDNATQFLDCIDSLSETTAQILYPILMTDTNGNYTVVRTNAQLEKIINSTNTNA